MIFENQKTLNFEEFKFLLIFQRFFIKKVSQSKKENDFVVEFGHSIQENRNRTVSG
jgi:hypothetical protein